jgi:hypothetical protein
VGCGVGLGDLGPFTASVMRINVPGNVMGMES